MAIGAALNGLVPAGQWVLFAALRFIVGIGLTAAVVPALTIVVELTPTRHRTLVTSFYVVFPGVRKCAKCIPKHRQVRSRRNHLFGHSTSLSAA